MAFQHEIDFPISVDWRFGDWIDVQTQLQKIGGKGDPANIPTGDEFAEFTRAMAFAACAEIHEMADEMRWKPWDDMRGRNVDRERVIAEGVDALHFLGNLFRAVNATGEEISTAYEKKAQKNLDRWREGYDALKDKCPHCHRSFSESDCVAGEFCEEIGHDAQR